MYNLFFSFRLWVKQSQYPKEMIFNHPVLNKRNISSEAKNRVSSLVHMYRQDFNYSFRLVCNLIQSHINSHIIHNHIHSHIRICICKQRRYTHIYIHQHRHKHKYKYTYKQNIINNQINKLFFFSTNIHNGINTPTHLLVKSINESYKKKNFNKIQWDCMYNDILKHKEKFLLKEIVTIINVLSHLHLGKPILIKLKPIILSKINNKINNNNNNNNNTYYNINSTNTYHSNNNNIIINNNNINSNSKSVQSVQSVQSITLISSVYIVKIFISYIKANIIDEHFLEQLYNILKTNWSSVSLAILINLIYHLNFYSSLKKDILEKIEEDAFTQIIKQLSGIDIQLEIEKDIEKKIENVTEEEKEEEKEEETKQISSNKKINRRKENGIKSHLFLSKIDEENVKIIDIKEKKLNDKNKNVVTKSNTVTLKDYQMVFLFYSLSNYLFHFYFKKEKNRNNELAIELQKLLNSIEIHIQNKKELISKKPTPFYLFLLYKGSLNNIYTFSESKVNKNLLSYMKDEIQDWIQNHLDRKEQLKKGHTNELIKYINILKQNTLSYFHNEKKYFSLFFDTNIFFIKKLLLYLQEKNKNMNKYYVWHKEKIEDTQKMLKQIELK